MFRTTRVLWVVNNALAKVCFARGEQDKSLPSIIIAKDEIPTSVDHFMSGELSFAQEVDIYRNRSVKEAAVMILLETAAAWKMVNKDKYATYCKVAASIIAEKTYKDGDILKNLDEVYLSNLERRERDKTSWERIEANLNSFD